jgi:hypothetical protein
MSEAESEDSQTGVGCTKSVEFEVELSTGH